MKNLMSARVRVLLAANALALAFFYVAATPSSAQYTTYCSPSAPGCICIHNPPPALPPGCHDDDLGDEFLCSSNEFCNEMT